MLGAQTFRHHEYALAVLLAWAGVVAGAGCNDDEAALDPCAVGESCAACSCVAPLKCRAGECSMPRREYHEPCESSDECESNNCDEGRCVAFVIGGGRCDACSTPCSVCLGAGPIGRCTDECTVMRDAAGKRVGDSCFREREYCDDDGLCRPTCLDPDDPIYGTPCPEELPICRVANQPGLVSGGGVCRAEDEEVLTDRSACPLTHRSDGGAAR